MHRFEHCAKPLPYWQLATNSSKDIKAMLGLVLHDDILILATHLFNQDAKEVMNFIKDLAHKGENLSNALRDLSSLFHQISMAKIIKNPQISAEIKALAAKISHQDLQIFYHFSTHGSSEIALAPSEQIGFEMTLLKMLTFNSAENIAENITENIAEKKTVKIANKISSQAEWEALTVTLKFNVAAAMLLKNTIFTDFKNGVLTLILDEKYSNLLTENIHLEISKVLQNHFGELTIKINLAKPKSQTLAQKQSQQNDEKKAKLQEDFLNDKNVQKLQQTFQAKVDLQSIQAVENISNAENSEKSAAINR
ncbi:MAG: hypothetical protein HAW58_02760 [Candidatus Thioglobus sp.]|nr:hypothetical protein [Candidatus Thioglobus sp.]